MSTKSDVRKMTLSVIRHYVDMSGLIHDIVDGNSIIYYR